MPRSWASVHNSGRWRPDLSQRRPSLGTSTSPANYLTGIGQGYVGASFGASEKYIGSLAEIVVYKSALTAAQVTAVNSYLISKWSNGIPVAASSAFTVQQAAATQLVFTTPPATATAGATMANVVVQLEDAFGRAVASNNVPVTLTLNGGGFLHTAR